MIFPRERVVHEHLNTSFTQLDAMLNELKADLFSGYVRLVARDYDGLVLLDGGRVLNAIDEAKGRCRTGVKALDGVLAKSRERGGMISVFQLSAEMAQLLADLSGSQVLYKDLTSDLTSLDRLLAGLRSRRHTGFIDVKIPGRHETATIFLRGGDVLEATLSRQGNVSDGPKVLDELARLAAADGAVFTVHSAQAAPPEASAPGPQGSDRQEQLSVWLDTLKTVENSVDIPTKPGTFVTAFKRACIELADTYPFLDPFAAEFEYRDGQIRYDGQAAAADFNQGLSRCLAQCVRALAGQPATRDLPARLSSAVGALKKRHGARLAEHGLAEALPDVFGD
jgi:hypothetical protein